MATPTAHRTLNAVVVSAGLMQKTVKARIGSQQWNNHIKKHYNKPNHVLVHDPRSSLRLGDVITIRNGWRVSKQVHHVVTSIIAPFGPPTEERPPVPTEEERVAERARKRAEKDVRRSMRRLKVGDEGKESEVVSKLEGEKEVA